MTVYDFCFMCHKCQHHLYVEVDNYKWLDDPASCPNCGEEGAENWFLLGRGNLGDFE